MKLSQVSRIIGLRSAAALGMGALMVLVPALQAAPQDDAKYGTIKGQLVWAGTGAPPAPAPLKVTDAYCAKTPIVSKELTIDPATKGVANAFAYLVNPVGENPELIKAILKETPEVVIDQSKCEYLPYATAILKDQAVLFKSSDPVGHNVKIDAGPDSMNPMIAANGKLPPKKFKAVSKRPILMSCSIHPFMAGYMMVLDHPFVAVTKADGTFEITGVPAGAQQMIVWQSTKGYVNAGKAKGMTVNVTAGKTVDVGVIKMP